MARGAKKDKEKGPSKPKRGFVLLAVAAGLVAAFGALSLLSVFRQQTTYYVLGQSVPARTQITPNLLVPVTVSTGGQPPNALSPAFLRNYPDDTYAQVALHAGDVVERSELGSLSRLPAGVPTDYVLASFQVAAQDAVAGKIRDGDRVDVAAVGSAASTTGEVSKIVLHNVLVVDVTTNPATITQAATASTTGSVSAGPESLSERTGVPVLYTVAVSPTDYATIALVQDMKLSIALDGPGAPPTTDTTVQANTVFGPGPVGDSSSTIVVPTPSASPGAATTGAPAAPASPAAPAPTGSSPDATTPAGTDAPTPASTPSN